MVQSDRMSSSRKNSVLLDGVMEKKGHFRRNWKRRYFVLTTSSLSYFKMDSSLKQWVSSPKLLRGSILVKDMTEIRPVVHRRRDFCFSIKVRKEKGKLVQFIIDAPSSESRSRWVASLRRCRATAMGQSGSIAADRETPLSSGSQNSATSSVGYVSTGVTLEQLIKDLKDAKSESDIIDVLGEISILLHGQFGQTEAQKDGLAVLKAAVEEKAQRTPELWTDRIRLVYKEVLFQIKSSVPNSERDSFTAIIEPLEEDSEQQGAHFKDSYTLGKIIGKGASSIVYEAYQRGSAVRYAVKYIKKIGLKRQEREALHQEVEIMRQMNHPNLVPLLDFFEEMDAYYLVTEMCTGGELFDDLIRREFYSEEDARTLMKSLTSAVAYLHDRGIVHRDIKPENILLSSHDEDSDIKLADFGFAKAISTADTATACGTPGYIAPEIVRGKPYGTAVDCWSLGVVLYILLCGYPPFPGENHMEILKRVVAAKVEFDSPYWDNVSRSARNMVLSLLNVDPEKRLTARQVLSHPWMTGEKEQEGELAEKDLSRALDELRKYNARAKFKAGVLTVRSAIRMSKALGQGSTGQALDETSPPQGSLGKSIERSPGQTTLAPLVASNSEAMKTVKTDSMKASHSNQGLKHNIECSYPLKIQNSCTSLFIDYRGASLVDECVNIYQIKLLKQLDGERNEIIIGNYSTWLFTQTLRREYNEDLFQENKMWFGNNQ